MGHVKALQSSDVSVAPRQAQAALRELKSYLQARVPHVPSLWDPVPLVASARHFLHTRLADTQLSATLETRALVWPACACVKASRMLRNNHLEIDITQNPKLLVLALNPKPSDNYHFHGSRFLVWLWFPSQ